MKLKHPLSRLDELLIRLPDVKNRIPIMFVEVKTSEESCSPDLIYLKKKFPEVDAIQVILHSEKDIKNEWNIRICGACGQSSKF